MVDRVPSLNFHCCLPAHIGACSQTRDFDLGDDNVLMTQFTELFPQVFFGWWWWWIFSETILRLMGWSDLCLFRQKNLKSSTVNLYRLAMYFLVKGKRGDSFLYMMLLAYFLHIKLWDLHLVYFDAMASKIFFCVCPVACPTSILIKTLWAIEQRVYLWICSHHCLDTNLKLSCLV